MKVTKINIDASTVSTISTTADSIKEEQENNLSQKEHIYIYYTFPSWAKRASISIYVIVQEYSQHQLYILELGKNDSYSSSQNQS